MGYYQWIVNGSQETCVDGNSPNVTRTFSNLTLYLMGLIPPDQVSPIYLHEFNPKPGDAYFNTWGPNCSQPNLFTGTKAITIQDIINANGVRLPSYADSQKNFSVAFVILDDYNTDAPQSFIDYVNEYERDLPEAWRKATDGNSSITF